MPYKGGFSERTPAVRRPFPVSSQKSSVLAVLEVLHDSSSPSLLSHGLCSSFSNILELWPVLTGLVSIRWCRPSYPYVVSHLWQMFRDEGVYNHWREPFILLSAYSPRKLLRPGIKPGLNWQGVSIHVCLPFFLPEVTTVFDFGVTRWISGHLRTSILVSVS